MECDLADAVTVLICRTLQPTRSRVRCERGTEDGLLIGEFSAVIGGLDAVPGIPLDESNLAVSYSTCARRQLEASDVNARPADRIDGGTDPCPAGVQNLEVVCATIRPKPLEGARDARAAVSAGAAVRIGRATPSDEAREDAVEDGSAAQVGAGLDAGVSNARVNELELLGEVVPRDVIRLDDGEGESDVGQSSAGHVGHGPGQGNQRMRGWEEGDERCKKGS